MSDANILLTFTLSVRFYGNVTKVSFKIIDTYFRSRYNFRIFQPIFVLFSAIDRYRRVDPNKVKTIFLSEEENSSFLQHYKYANDFM